ncbi:MAG: response regulator [Tepidisphaeraceae bacterium]
MEKRDGELILLVDDDRDVARSVQASLADEGYRVIHAPDGMAGLNACRADKPALVLLDLRMPGMDGIEVLRTLAGEMPELPVVVVSGQGTMDDVISALRLGAWDYLMKPIARMAMLHHAIRKSLERARLIRENQRYRRGLETEVKRQTDDLRRQAEELRSANAALERKSVALEEVLATVQQQKDSVTSRIVSNIELTILPLLDTLEPGLSRGKALVAEQIRLAIADLTSQFRETLGGKGAGLTPAQMRVCGHIRRGLSCKQIAQVEGISVGTVHRHREQIRRKLRLVGTDANLASFLQKLQ